MPPVKRFPAMARRFLLVLPAAALLAFAGAARAEGPVEGGESDDAAKVREISIRISKALKENEEALASIARGEKATPRPVDISLPKHNHEGGT